MLQFGGLWLYGSIEVIVIVIITVSQLLGLSQGKVMVRVRLGLGLWSILTTYQPQRNHNPSY